MIVSIMKVLAILLLIASVAYGERAWDRIHGKNRAPRITGGEEVEPNSVPWQVGLNLFAEDGQYFCGGSLLAPNIVLTAAHCCELTDNITTILGAHKIRDETESTQQRIAVGEVLIHPNWNSQNIQNDVCLLFLESDAEINDAVSTVRLPSRSQEDDNFANVEGVATGWGLDSDQATQISPVLRSVEAPIVTNAQCRLKFGIIGIGVPLHETNICIDTEGGKSTCSGDSGGPLTVHDSENGQFVVGITSFGVSLGCEKGYPAVFTRVTSYLDWISLETGIPIDGDVKPQIV